MKFPSLLLFFLDTLEFSVEDDVDPSKRRVSIFGPAARSGRVFAGAEVPSGKSFKGCSCSGHWLNYLLNE